MKPKRIFLIRHGQSQANADSSLYEHTPDYALRLTTLGKEQAFNAGLKLKEIISNNIYVSPMYGEHSRPLNHLLTTMFYVSPYYRARETYYGVIKGLSTPAQGFENPIYREEPRIREQEFGHLRTIVESKAIIKERNNYGTFY